MGVCCRVHLPPNVRLDRVADVIGAVAGCPVVRFKLDTAAARLATRVERVRTGVTSQPTMATITLDHPTLDGEPHHFVHYHFEGGLDSFGGGGRQLLPKSTAFWIAVMRRVVDFFGGELDYNDGDDGTAGYTSSARPATQNCPEDGDEWYDLEDRIAAITPLTEAEWRDCDQYAAYKIGD